jgi:hypothetical protein
LGHVCVVTFVAGERVPFWGFCSLPLVVSVFTPVHAALIATALCCSLGSGGSSL